MIGSFGPDAANLEKRLSEGKFDMNDYKLFLQASSKLGNISDSLKYIPGTKRIREQIENIESVVGGQDLSSKLKIIDAMTDQERAKPEVLFNRAFKARQRIATEANVQASDVNQLLDNFKIAEGMMLKLFEMRKNGKSMPNDMTELMTMVKEGGGFSKEVNEILKKRQK